MAVFIDTGVFYAAGNTADQHHGHANAILKRIFQKQFGQAYTSDYIVDEAVTLTQARTKDRKKSIRMLDNCLHSPELFNILNVNEDEFLQAAKQYGHCDELSFTDCTTLVLMRKNGIRHIATLDSGFRQFDDVQLVEP